MLPITHHAKPIHCKCGERAKRLMSAPAFKVPGGPTYEARAEADSRRMVEKNKKSYNLIDE
jgi:predicted nucleic acid-binding Zn ribbon protein